MRDRAAAARCLTAAAVSGFALAVAAGGCGAPASYPGDLLPACLAPAAPADAPPDAPVVLRAEDLERLPSGLALIRAGSARPAPAFLLADESGVVHTPESLRGRVVRLEMWATWCATCRADFPHLQRQHETWADRGVVVLAVCRESKREDFEQAVRKDWRTFPVIDANDARDFPFPLGAFPTSVVLDAQGRVRAFWQGWRPPEDVDAVLARLVDEAS